MNSLRKRCFVAMGLCLMVLPGAGCTFNEKSMSIFDNAAWSEPVERKRIRLLEVGMSVADVEKAIGFAGFMDSVPVALYSAEGGGYYYLVFYDESESGALFADQEAKLQYVVYFAREASRSGHYVVPPAKEGMPYDVNRR